MAERRPDQTRGSTATAGSSILAASILGSGAAFLESTVVSVALPSIGHDLALGMDGLQWVMNSYLLTLTALMLLGGAVGDRYSRVGVFRIGALAFAACTAGCAVAPGFVALFATRLLQGAAAALLVPNSLAMLEDVYRGEERGAAIGKWAAWSGISTAIGPLVGGWLAEIASWRWVFAGVVPFALAAAWIAGSQKPAEKSVPAAARKPIDYPGAGFVSLGLAGLVTALIIGPTIGFGRPLVVASLLTSLAAFTVFLIVELRSTSPLLPLGIFRSRQFSGVNLTTLLLYAALSGLFFLLMLELQNDRGYGPLAAGASLLPINLLMLALSPRAGRVAERMGARGPMTTGGVIAAIGMLLFARLPAGGGYLSTVLPATLVFGLGLATFVAPLTATALAAAGERHKGLASGVNNAVARLAGLLATAAIPFASGLGGVQEVRGQALARGFTRAAWISAGLCALGSAVAWVTVRGGRARATNATPS